tara:strand:+ start:338 stop:1888 length:1551 start_codon:yes stop_codon:yes gene_type:complete
MASLPINTCGQYGIIRDVFPHELPDGAWSEGKNVRFVNGYAEQMKGHLPVYGASSIEPYFLLPYSTSGARNWIYAGANKAYSVTVDVHTNITRQSGGVDVNYTATADNVWSGTDLSGIAIFNNGTDAPQQWPGTGRAANLSNWPSGYSCKALRSYKYCGIAMNLTISGNNYPHRVLYSQPAEPGSVPSSWDIGDDTKDAGEFDLSKTDGRLIDGAVMGDSFYLYKESSIYRMSYVGGGAIFNISDPITEEAGALALNCIASFPGGHVVLGQGDIFVFNGAQAESIIDARMRRWLQTSLDATYFNRSFLTTNPTKNEIWVCLPLVGYDLPNIALIWNYKTNTWTFRDLPSIHYAASGVIDTIVTNSIDSRANIIDSYTDPIDYNEYTQSSKRLVMADDASEMFLADASRQFDGMNYTSYIARTGMDFGNSNRFKFVSSIRPMFDGGTNNVIQIYVGGANDLTTAITWSEPFNFTIGQDFEATFEQEWRYIAIKFETTVQTYWRLKSMVIEYEFTGMY